MYRYKNYQLKYTTKLCNWHIYNIHIIIHSVTPHKRFTCLASDEIHTVGLSQHNGGFSVTMSMTVLLVLALKLDKATRRTNADESLAQNTTQKQIHYFCILTPISKGLILNLYKSQKTLLSDRILSTGNKSVQSILSMYLCSQEYISIY